MPFSRPSLAASVLMLGLSFAAPVLIFSGCASTSTTASPLSTDAVLIDTGLSIIAPVILASKGITPEEVSAVNMALAAVHSAAAALSSGASMTSQQMIVTGVQAIADVASKYLPVGSQEALAVIAAGRLAVLFLPAGTVGASATASMSLTEARARLAAVRK